MRDFVICHKGTPLVIIKGVGFMSERELLDTYAESANLYRPDLSGRFTASINYGRWSKLNKQGSQRETD